MASYSYIAIDKLGKTLKGSLDSDTQEHAADELKKQGLTVASVVQTGALGRDLSLKVFESKPTPRDMAVFCRQFVSIISAGVSVVDAFDMLSAQTENKRLREAISECKMNMEKGEALADSMAEHRDLFSDIFVTMAEAGEASGSLDVSFSRMADQFEKQAKLKATVKKATVYPTAVGIIAVIVVIAMLAFVIPAFQDMFDDLGTELPGITQFVVNASEFVQGYWYLLAAIVAGIAVVIGAFKKTNAGKHFFGKLSMKIPLLGTLTVKTASAQMARTLSTLLGSGISLIEALEITSGVVGNVLFEEALLEARDDVAVGNPLSDSLKRGQLFPPLVYHMLSIGEETGDIEGMLDKLASYYEDEVEQATQQLMAAMEPMIIVLMAVVIGTIVIAIILPMVTMYEGLDSL